MIVGDIKRYSFELSGYEDDDGYMVTHPDHLKAIEDKDAEIEGLKACLRTIAEKTWHTGLSAQAFTLQHLAKCALKD